MKESQSSFHSKKRQFLLKQGLFLHIVFVDCPTVSVEGLMSLHFNTGTN